MNKLTVIDFFCGAGGFSEGFRQQGYEIIRGFDKWKPAIDTYNHNFGSNKGVLMDILDFESNIELIEKEIPDTDVIIGSPPCVSFSSSNKSGNADKAMGIRLIEIFLRIIAIKKYKSRTTLKAWFMENVSGSLKHMKDYYTFSDLGLHDFALRRKLSPAFKAIIIKGNSRILNSADFGSPQQRLRAITGEIIHLNTFIEPTKTHSKEEYVTLGYIKSNLPSPNSQPSTKLIQDPLYNNIIIPQESLSDQFYDTGLYEAIWSHSKEMKVNHGFMGKMSFPENEQKPSRTVTATKIATSREALIFKSEFKRKGNGEYRTPTVREAATLMSFPITYQFIGTENTKWKLVGNAVCPSISRALAATLRRTFNLNMPKVPLVNKHPRINKEFNLNNFKQVTFNAPPKKNKNARFRSHPFKYGNITVTLSNYPIVGKEKPIGKWITSVQYGNGKGFPHEDYPDGFYNSIENVIKNFENGTQFLEVINNGFTTRIANSELLQRMHEEQCNIDKYLEPFKLIKEVSNIIDRFSFDDPLYTQTTIFKSKSIVPKKQLLALYAINKIATIANKRTPEDRN